MFQEFKKFLLRGNVIDLAVGVVVGAAFGAVVSALVSDFITPLIAAIVKVPDFSNLAFTFHGSKFSYGDFINKVISFLLIAATVFFFIVKPINMLFEGKKKPEKKPKTKKCPQCLGEIPAEASRCMYCTQTVA